jgi:hypothetical protein
MDMQKATLQQELQGSLISKFCQMWSCTSLVVDGSRLNSILEICRLSIRVAFGVWSETKISK